MAYRAALQELSRERAPYEWAVAQNNPGVALENLGARESGTASLEEAVTAYGAALQELRRKRLHSTGRSLRTTSASRLRSSASGERNN